MKESGLTDEVGSVDHELFTLTKQHPQSVCKVCWNLESNCEWRFTRSVWTGKEDKNGWKSFILRCGGIHKRYRE